MAETPLEKKAREKADESAAAAADRVARENTDLAKAAKENAARPKDKEAPKDPDAEVAGDSPFVAAAKKRRREAKAKGQAAALKDPPPAK